VTDDGSGGDDAGEIQQGRPGSEPHDGERRRRRRRGRGGRDDGSGHHAASQPRPDAPGARQAPPQREVRASEPAHAVPRSARPEASADESDHDEPAPAYGRDDDSPAQPITLAAVLPAESAAADPDPATFELASAALGEDVAGVVGVRFVAAGRVQWCDAGDADYSVGERVIVDSDRGHRVATVATGVTRRSVRDRSLRRVIRRAHEGDRGGSELADRELRVAKDVAAALGIPLKVFRVEKASGKLFVYYTSDERLDIRDFVRDLAQQTSARIELRQLGARDEAKAVGGIGSCGLTLCCTTWLPEFVPVSIKMAKDQGLVLSPTKVAGQCGRLKCCLVYEQAAYAELRKGLPKLGKRVISARGEGRVVEVDVLRQRVRVSYAPGDTEVLPASEVRPMFPPQQAAPHHDQHDHDDADEPEPDLS
jgi:cell fate regulator YaaT (PSP1 superfamily)